MCSRQCEISVEKRGSRMNETVGKLESCENEVVSEE